ncbi:DUF3141 domain-containing protein [Bradyrhizobium sp. CCGB20]|uniref:DUF3141 domain-containing protein n=1 Tax=Bradyrhizobium sp. CCGB20 TaxID=2949633 RepID=UPI0020B377D4|nr:DUF3141 domain-containing protein [Bradyrhizobium sp. CCGB20]MCP3397100.1 DUF3141 domain-containing protein [Bradyrhizobium sp. CCGB20]
MSDSFQRSNAAESMKAQRAELELEFNQSPFRIYADRTIEVGAKTINVLQMTWTLRAKRSCEMAFSRLPELLASGERLAKDLWNLRKDGRIGLSWREYIRDAGERAILLMDVLRESGDIFLEYEAAGCPPALFYEYETIMDGRDLPVKSNFVLLRMIPAQDVTVDYSHRRPFVIIPPRAGHTAGVGAHAADSQVGVALRAGHPVYLVSFRREPEPDQHLSDVAYAEAAFVREVMRRHPRAALPAIIGNCQAGWATLVMAATNPDLTGPITINGSPVSAVSGNIGDNTFRYIAGIFGGVWIPMFLCDLGKGMFDGANLIHNFELLNPERLFLKYADLFRDVDTARESFLATERWWASFCLLHENEICWILENLFIGNRLARNRAYLASERQHVDLKQIGAPIIVFTSHGDNVTPPQQALNWITDAYENEEEIRVRGQRIIYLVHNDVGHLGIFVSSKVVNREFRQVATTLEAIEALMPGLYEMCVTDIQEHDGRKDYSVELVQRSFKDILAFNDNYRDERPFGAVDRASQLQAQVYHTVARPFVRAAVTKVTADASRTVHPQRLSRALLSSQNLMLVGFKSRAEQVLRSRAKARADNPFLIAEALYVQHIERTIIFWRDLRDTIYELVFHSMWNTPLQDYFGSHYEVNARQTTLEELRSRPDVCFALKAIATGGFIEAVVRMMTLLVNDRGGIRRDRLDRWSRVLTQDEPFRSLASDRLNAITRQQTIIAILEPERAIETLPLLLDDSEARRRAYLVSCYIPGPVAEMSPSTTALLRRFAQVLDQPPIAGDVTEDPLVEMGRE